MKITHIKLENWGPHKNLDVNLDSGIVGIVGRNGCGKSNLLQAIDYAFTGNLDGKTGASYIRNYGIEGGASKAVVQVKFRKGSKEGTITREVGPKSSKRLLVWEGEKYTKLDEVDEMIKSILGTDKASLANAAFIKQGDVAAIVQGTPAERNEIFRKLVQLAFAEQRSNELNSRIVAMESGLVDYTEAKAETAAKLASRKEELAALHSELASYDWLDDIGTLQAVRHATHTLSTLRSAESKAENAAADLVRLHESVAAVKADVTRATGISSDDIESVYLTAGKEAMEARDKMAAAEAVAMRWAAKKSADSDLEKAEKTLAEHLEALGLNGSSYTEVLQAKQAKVDEARRLVDEVAAADAVRSEERNLRRELDDVVKQTEEAKRKLKTARDEVAMLDAVKSALLSTDVNLAMARNRLKIVSESKDGKATCPCCGQEVVLGPDDTVEAITNNINHMEAVRTSLTESLNATQGSVAAAEGALSVIEGRREVIQRKLEDAAAKLSSIVWEGMPEYGEAVSAMNLVDRDLRAYEARVSAMLEATKLRDMCQARVDEAANAIKDDGPVQDITALSAEYSRKAAVVDALSAHYHKYAEAVRSLTAAELCLEDCNTAQAEASAEYEKAINDDLYKAAVDECDIDDSYELMQAVAGKYEEKAELRKQAASVEGAIQAAKQDLELIEAKIERNAKKAALIEDLKKVRQIVGKNGIPMSYMDSTFRKMSAVVSDLLAKMGANFTVEPDPSLPVTFKFTRTDNGSGYAMPQEKLSGGQAIRLALSVLIACQQLVLPDMGLLVLDEPSSHVDDEGVASMRDMFGELGVMLDSADMQLIVVDHNVNLTSSFGRTVQLGLEENH